MDALQENAGHTVALGVRRADGTEETITATLRPKAELSPTRGALGVAKLEQTYDTTTHDFGSAIQIAGNDLVRWGGLILSGLGQLVDGLIMDFMAQLQAHLMSHQYEGLMKKANLRGYGRSGQLR